MMIENLQQVLTLGIWQLIQAFWPWLAILAMVVLVSIVAELIDQ